MQPFEAGGDELGDPSGAASELEPLCRRHGFEGKFEKKVSKATRESRSSEVLPALALSSRLQM